jgi:hypothetical protein
MNKNENDGRFSLTMTGRMVQLVFIADTVKGAEDFALAIAEIMSEHDIRLKPRDEECPDTECADDETDDE